METNEVEFTEYAEQPVPEMSSELDDLREQLSEYKLLAQSLEKRIISLHRDCEKKDEEIATLKAQRLQSSSSEKVGETQSELDMEDSSILRKMFVGGLNSTTTNESLKEYFSQFGEVAQCMVMKDTNTNRPRGFGFVIYVSSSGVDAAQAARPHTVDGKVVDTKRALPKGEQPTHNTSGETCKRVFIGGLKTTTEKDTLLTYFSQYGEVEHVDIPEDKTAKRKRGFAYVTFTDSDPVDKVTIIKHHTIDGRRCEVKKAVTREEMESMKSKPGGGDPGGFMPGHAGGNPAGNYWSPPNAFAPPVQPFHPPPYGYPRPPGQPPIGVPPFANRPPMPMPPNIRPAPAGRGYPHAPWANNGAPGKNNRGVGPVRGKTNHAQRSAGPYGGGYGLRSA